MIGLINYKIVGVLFLLLIVSVNVYAQNPSSLSSSTTLELRDEGVSQGNIKKIDCTGAGVTCSRTGVVGTVNVPGGGGSAYNQIQEEGTNLTQRTILNFIGTSITCVDDGATKTNCTISGGGSGLTHPEVMSRISLGF